MPTARLLSPNHHTTVTESSHHCHWIITPLSPNHHHHCRQIIELLFIASRKSVSSRMTYSKKYVISDDLFKKVCHLGWLIQKSVSSWMTYSKKCVISDDLFKKSVSSQMTYSNVYHEIYCICMCKTKYIYLTTKSTLCVFIFVLCIQNIYMHKHTTAHPRIIWPFVTDQAFIFRSRVRKGWGGKRSDELMRIRNPQKWLHRIQRTSNILEFSGSTANLIIIDARYHDFNSFQVVNWYWKPLKAGNGLQLFWDWRYVFYICVYIQNPFDMHTKIYYKIYVMCFFIFVSYTHIPKIYVMCYICFWKKA